MYASSMHLILIAIGGAVGAVARVLVTQAATALCGERFPWGTLIVNVVGCLVLGALMKASQEHVGDATRLAIGSGLMGAFTTFSTFGYDTVSRWQQGEMLLAVVNVFANLSIGFTAVLIGMALAHWWFGVAAGAE